MKRHIVFVAWALLMLSAAPALGQTAAPPAAPAADAPAKPDKPPLKPEELEQLLAPIALYPDSLLTQVFMASTYPLEIVEADRWAKANKDLKGDALAKELEKQTWDPSVRSLVNFPQVLSTMSEKLDMTMKLGDAFIGQQQDVMNTVQQLRNKAQKAGNLKSNDQQTVTTAPPPPATQQTTVVVQAAVPPPAQIITIQSPSPQVIYVPTYEPTVVYGAWPYPAYPPYPYYPPRPPGYVATAAVSFGLGVACGAAWGYAWGHSDWGHNDVDININQNNNFNNNINRSNYQNLQTNRANVGGGNSSWKHDPAHRQGVPYRNQATAQRVGANTTSAQAAQAREQYRGRADAGRQNLGRDQAAGRMNDLNTGARDGQQRVGQSGSGQRAGAGGGNAGQNRDAAGARDRQSGAAANRGSSGGAFDGANRSGGETRAASQRGQSSRTGGSSGGGGGSRGGGGAARGGGGRR